MSNKSEYVGTKVFTMKKDAYRSLPVYVRIYEKRCISESYTRECFKFNKSENVGIDDVLIELIRHTF